jgi:hypothetical protein
MAFASYQRLPYIQTYEQALAFIKKTAPIRGRDIIPLGARRDADKFNIRITPTDDIEVLFYRSVILTYLKDGDLLFSSPATGWGITEAWIFECLLPQVARAKVTRGFLHLRAVKGAEYVYPVGKTRAYADLQTIDPTDSYVWRLKRTETNKVRTRYGAFYRYVKGMVGVRKAPHPHYDKEFVIYLTLGEVEEAMTNEWIRKCLSIRHKPPVSTPRSSVGAQLPMNYAGWRAAMGEFIEMITPHESEQVQTENFYKAFLTLAACQASAYFFSQSPSHDMYVCAGSPAKVLDEMLFKYYSDDVFVQEKVPVGRVPDDRYRLWVTRDGA